MSRAASSYEQENGSLAYRRSINEAFFRMNRARHEFRDDMSLVGQARDEPHRELELALLNVYSLLRPYKFEEEEIRQLWQQAGLDALPDECFQQVVNEQVNVSGGRVDTNTSVEVTHAQPQTLLNAAEAFDMIAQKLGFLPEPATSRKTSLLTNVAE